MTIFNKTINTRTSFLPTTGLISMLIAYTAPIHTLLIILILLILSDLLTAIMRLIKLHRYKRVGIFKKIIDTFNLIESRKFRRTPIKMFLYLLFMFLVFGIENSLFPGSLFITKTAFGLLSMVELKSIAENCSIITNDKTFLNIFKMFNNKMTDKINKSISGDDEK